MEEAEKLLRIENRELKIRLAEMSAEIRRLRTILLEVDLDRLHRSVYRDVEDVPDNKYL